VVFLDVFAARLDFFAAPLRLAAMSSSYVVMMTITPPARGASLRGPPLWYCAATG
jgi:hypothetical protein